MAAVEAGKCGVFITLEGGEGVGKSTQLALLATMARARGHDVVETREPGGSVGAEAIRGLLLHDGIHWNARAEALLFAAARADHVATVIQPALARGAWVICDRFIDSTRAYQGGDDGLPDADIMTLHGISCGGLLPDRTLLLRLDATEAARRRASRVLARADRIESRDAAYHDRVVTAFDTLAAAEPERFRVIDAAGPTTDVAARLWAQLDFAP